MYQHILVAVHTSKDYFMLDSAIRMAQVSGARVTALHVIEQIPYCAKVKYIQHGERMPNVFETQANAVITQCEDIFQNAGVDGVACTAPLPPFGATVGEVVANYARCSNVDLVMLGKTGSDFWRFLRENVSRETLRYASCSVLAVPRVVNSEALEVNAVTSWAAASSSVSRCGLYL